MSEAKLDQRFYVTYRISSVQNDDYSTIEAADMKSAKSKVEALVGIDGYAFIYDHLPKIYRTGKEIPLQKQEIVYAKNNS